MREDPLLTAAGRETPTIASTPVTEIFEQGVPDGVRRLIWEEFFASRNRGIDWKTHLPWAVNNKEPFASTSIVTEAGTVVAALLVRYIPGSTTAMIGYVCVDPAFRGHGLSSRLINLTAASICQLGMTRMVLWTSKPSVYERVGFIVTAQERRLTLRGSVAGCVPPITLAPWPASDSSSAPGLPPFATAGWRAASSVAEVVFVDTPMGAALLDQSGTPDVVLAIMSMARPGDWSATLDSDHLLYRHAIAKGACVKDAPGPLTMCRLLKIDVTHPAYIPPAYRI